MDIRFVAFFVAVISVFAANGSEGNRKSAESFLDSGGSLDVQEIGKDTAEQVWKHCRQELKDLELRHSPINSHNSVEFVPTSSVKRNIQKTIADLPPKKKETVLACLREKNFAPRVLRNEQEIWSTKYQKLISSWASIPRRLLRRKVAKQVVRAAAAPVPAPLQSPVKPPPPPSVKRPPPSPVEEPPPSPVKAPPPTARGRARAPPPPAVDETPPRFPAVDSPPKLPKIVPPPSPPPPVNNSHTKYIVIAAVSSAVAALAVFALILLLCGKKIEKVEPKDGQRDEKPLLNFSTSNISAGSAQKSNAMCSKTGIENFKPPPTAGGSLDANLNSSQTASLSRSQKTSTSTSTSKSTSTSTSKSTSTSTYWTTTTTSTTTSTATPTPTPPPPTPPPPPKPRAPAPPPPPNVHRPPNPPVPAKPPPPHHRRSSTGGTSVLSDESDAPKTKLKPFFWDKVLASPDQTMVWHEIKAGSFQFNEEMMENLFGYVPDKNKNERRKDSPSFNPGPQLIKIIDPKKSQNLAILLRALNVTTEEVCEALQEGNELPQELVQTLLKMAPTTDEELKLRLYTGDVALLGPAERFLKVLVEIPFAFKRLEALLFVSTFQEEYSSLKEAFATLEVASTELRNSRLFLKLLEAVLKTGNRMNDGTYRGGAMAFKLDTLLKLSDVKGTDGKTTLLHFVVQEIIKSEGLRAARRLKESPSMSSVKTEDLAGDASHELEEYHRSLGLQVVSGVSSELANVRKAAVFENENLSEAVVKLSQSLARTKQFLEIDMKSIEESDFYNNLSGFIHQSESDITCLAEEEKRIMALVRKTGDYFHGKAGKDEGLHLFAIVRDFLIMLDKACKDVKSSSALPSKTPRKETVPSSPSPPSQESQPESSLNMHQQLFPAIREQQMDDDFSSDDES
ncbi:Formin-like protein 5 [Sesamum alatum]|uniref:Formin-like protein n=1 Tax=Sesamum alatum TaxID=300844 RepID=A0AAE1XYM4_9LAMI|nr:Formin-like protein 5 [Sesamum alatum]